MFLTNYSIEIYILFVIAVSGFLMAIFLFTRQMRSKKLSAKSFKLDELFEALGGKTNINGTRANISKIYFELYNNKIIKPDKLKMLGATGIMVKSKEVVVIFGKRSSEISNIINQELKR